MLLLLFACGLRDLLEDSTAPTCGDTRAWYRDADGDGHGDTREVWVTCEADPGWVEVGGDCDDADPTRAEDCSGPADSGGDSGR